MRRLLIVVLLAVSPASLFAQPLADRVPADALLYVGWAGSSNLGAQYDQSHLKAVLAASDLPRVFTEFMPRLTERVSRSNARAGDIVGFIDSVTTILFRRPTAFYFGGVDFTDPRNPQPRMEIICDAGDEAASLTKQLQTAIDAAGKTKTPLKVIPSGTVVRLVIGPQKTAAAAQAMLGNDGRFKELMAQLTAAPVAMTYVDLEGVVALIDRAPVRGKRQADVHANWNKLRDALALDKLRTFGWAGAFDGKDWSTRAFLAAPAPRTGILAGIDAKPVSDDVLKLIPSTATMLGAGTFDPGKLLAGIRATAGKVDPSTTAKIDQGLDRFRTMTGLDLQKDLLDPLGEQWAYFCDPNLAGGSSFSMTLINKLDDPVKMDASLTQLANSATNILSRLTASSEVKIAFRETTTPSGLKIHFLGTPIVRPSWAVNSGVLYVGLFPQVVAAAAQRPAGKSILDNDGFMALRKRLGQGYNASATSIQFVDLPRTAPLVYPTWIAISGYVGAADLFGVPSPAMVIPPLSDLLPYLAPAGAVSWVDNAGWHAHGVSPFPGATVIGSDPTISVATPALLTSILLPSLNRSREVANRVKCASNERQIGQAILLYANENKGKYPPDLGTLVKTQPIDVDVFICPDVNDSVSAEIRSAPKDTQAAWVNDNSSYVYVGQKLRFNSPAETVVLYERADNHEQDGMNFLYADGHVEWQSSDVAEQLIKAAEGHGAPTTAK